MSLIEWAKETGPVLTVVGAIAGLWARVEVGQKLNRAKNETIDAKLDVATAHILQRHEDGMRGVHGRMSRQESDVQNTIATLQTDMREVREGITKLLLRHD